MKACPKCGKTKPFSEFSKNKRSKDGLQSWCKTCKNRRYQEDPEFREKALERQRLRLQDPEYREKKNEQQRLRYQEDPEYREKAKERQRLRYQEDPEYREKVRERERLRYQENPEYREKKNERERLRYQDPEYREKVRERDRLRLQNPEYREKENEQQRLRYQEDPEYREKKKERQRQHYQNQKDAQPGCVYEIINKITNRTYVGQTTIGEIRWKQHTTHLKARRHSNNKLQKDFDELGIDSFEWRIIKTLPKEEDLLLKEEAKTIQQYINEKKELYNLSLTIEQLKMLTESE